MLLALFLAPFASRAAPRSEFTMSQMLHYPYAAQLAAAIVECEFNAPV
jgi:hypothetical protein